MTHTVFYSWQSDLPNSTNRNFIESAIKAAVKQIQTEAENDVDYLSAVRDSELKLDKDTQGISGSPPIVEIIFNKIATCAIFVPDMTFVGKSDAGRLIPNPNVLVEYGWALSTVSHLRIVPIMNAYYGEPSWETLPFDMRHLLHPFAFRVSPEASAEERKAAKKALVGYLVKQFKVVLQSGLLDDASTLRSMRPLEKIALLKDYLSGDQDRIKLYDLLNDEAERTFAAVNKDDLLAIPSHYNTDELRRRARIFEAETLTLRQMLATACFWGRNDQATNWIAIIEQFDRLWRQGSGPTVFLNLQRYPALLLFQTSAFAAFANNEFSTLARIMTEGEYANDPQIERPCQIFVPDRLLSGGAFGELRDPHPEGKKWKTPGSLHLKDCLREATEALIPNTDRFDRLFDRFEYLHRLIVTDQALQNGKSRLWATDGRFVWKNDPDLPGTVYEFFDKEAETKDVDWPLLKSGLFGGSIRRFREAKDAIDERLKNQWWNYAVQ